MDSATTLTVDHPAWQTGADDIPVRLVEHHGTAWLALYRDAPRCAPQPRRTSNTRQSGVRAAPTTS